MLFKMSSLYCLVKFAQTQRVTFLAAGAFFLGLGLYDKANFIWYLTALSLTVIIVWRKQFMSMITRRNILIACSFFLLGCWPLLVYNIATKGKTLEGHLRMPANFVSFFQQKTDVLARTLNGSAVYNFVNGEWINPIFPSFLSVADFRGTLMPWVLLGAFIVAVLVLVRKSAPGQKVLASLMVLGCGILAQIYATYDATGSHHVMMLYPFPQIVLAHMVSILIFERRFIDKDIQLLKRIGRYATIGVIVILIASNVIVDVKYLKSFAQEGGKGIWSSAIYDLVKYAVQHKNQTYLLMDWGFNTQLLLLSRGSINKEEIFWSLLGTHDWRLADGQREDELIDDLYHQWTWNPSNIFVFHAERYTQFKKPRRIFDKMVERYNLKAEIVKVFLQGDGSPVYLLYKVSRCASANEMCIDHCLFYKEAEEFDDKSGGAIDFKEGASQGKALGMFWGRDASDFVSYKFHLGKDMDLAVLVLRVAFEGANPQTYHILLDGGLVQIAVFDPTKGWGYTSNQWKLVFVHLGRITQGAHSLMIRPRESSSTINIDFVALCEHGFTQ